MIRVCHVQLFSILSGVQRSMLESISTLDPARYESHVVCKEPGPLSAELDRRGIPVHFAPSLTRPISPRDDYRAYRELREIFGRGFDIVHTHSSKPGILGRLAARHAGVPKVIHHVHAFAFHEFSPWPKRFVYGQIERHAAAYCDHMLFVNREERDLVVGRGWLPAERCQTIYNGVDLRAVHPDHRPHWRQVYRPAWKVAEDEVVILFLGRLEYPKQPLILADIAAQLQQLRPEVPWRLVVAGSGPEEAALRSLVRQRGLDQRVTFLGWQQDPQGVLHASDVALLTSLAEGLPRSLIEAQAAGLPSVASAAKGNREVVVPGTGFLCGPKDVLSYSTALMRLIDRPALRDAQGRAARQHAQQCFDKVANNRQMTAVYDALVAG